METKFKQLENIYSIVVEFLVNYSFQLFGAIIIFCIGLFIAKRVSVLILKQCQKKNLDITLSNFIANVVKLLIIALTAMVCLGKLGIEITPFVAAIGAASLGAGLAIQGALSNYSAGLTIIVARPFIVGNTINVKGVNGLVKKVKLGQTILTDEDGVEITIPNKHIIGEIIHNSFENTLFEGSIGVSYDSDATKAINIIKDCLSKMSDIAQSPAPQVGIDAFGEIAIRVNYRCWIRTEKFYDCKYRINQKVLDALRASGIKISFLQKEIKTLS